MSEIFLVGGGQIHRLIGERGETPACPEAKFKRGDIAIDGKKIVKLAEHVRPAAEDNVIDLKGAWLLPGLIDCHVHITQPTDSCDYLGHAKRNDAEVALFAAKAAERTLLSGITTIREVGGWNFVEIAVRDAINRGQYAGPRMLVAGRILSITTSGMDLYPGMYEIADGPDAVKAAAFPRSSRVVESDSLLVSRISTWYRKMSSSPAVWPISMP